MILWIPEGQLDGKPCRMLIHSTGSRTGLTCSWHENRGTQLHPTNRSGDNRSLINGILPHFIAVLICFDFFFFLNWLNGIECFSQLLVRCHCPLFTSNISIRMVLIGRPFSEELTVFFVLREKSYWVTGIPATSLLLALMHSFRNGFFIALLEEPYDLHFQRLS